ncbi:sensor histidine kinase [Atopomonas sediminilitoris]|uniref:sensor histidine kinase n=1 Tax=Atopomonas sediminilitoris TaxID=2919919 RepID=UPI001F4D84DA|nr:ATP-binding protein [Atopomonas sediminilitoris]MCJ8169887.1 ATP-binding protein [Atopomonas sediminilitoris]
MPIKRLGLHLQGTAALRILRLYNLYRVVLGLVLVLVVSGNVHHDLLKLSHDDLFSGLSWGYLISNVLISVTLLRPPGVALNFALGVFDIALLGALYYSAGGAPSGTGNLMIIAVAIANILVPGRTGLLLAALATLVVMSVTVHMTFTDSNASSQFLQAGTLGGLFFAAALFIQGVTRRAQQSETIAEQRAADVAGLQEMNTLILQRMRTGILVVDASHQVLLANPGAQSLLGQQNLTGQYLDPLTPELVKRLQQWLHNPTLRPQSFRGHPNGPELLPSFVPLKRGEHANYLVFIEDLSQIAQQAQQLKLASLGRLTAGISHEIRNPLGAISHAAQLLQESEALDKPDRRLAQIIQDHSRRMNLVIENVLQLSRRGASEPQLLDLKYWLHRFASEFRSTHPQAGTLHLDACQGSVQTRMDPNQLTQVLNNLVQNGLRYSQQKNGQAQLWLKLFKDANSELPVLEVLDDGPGVAPERREQLFEPFYTTESKGTGLGLYISRELCESNQARLDYQPRAEGGSCFRITFAHPRKMS